MKKKKFIILLGIIISTLIVVFCFNNDFLYKTPIIKINSIKEKKLEENINALGLKDTYYLQEISGVFTNTKNKGKKIVIENTYASSKVETEKYSLGDKVFFSKNEIQGLKRDSYIITVLVIFIFGIILVGNIKGITTIISVIINTIIFYIGAKLYLSGINFLLLCIIESFLFSGISLILSNGFNKKTYIAIISVFISFLILILMSIAVARTTNYKGINFNEISFLTVPAMDVFICELLIGGLGAIMDIAITIVSSASELISKAPNISKKNLIKSLSNIGSDVMGTMTNVLFFTYFCGSLPIFVLSIRNGFSIYNFFTSNFSIEISRFLVGSIGILLTIPVSIIITTFFYKRGEKYE